MRDLIYEAEDTRTFLKLYIKAKQARSKGLSLRQFAKRLGVSVASLSAFLTGSRTVSSEFILNFCDRMNLNTREIEHLLALHLISSDASTASKRLRDEMRARAVASRKDYLSKEMAELLYHWRTGALLEATRVPSLLENRVVLARDLGMTESKLELLIGQLLKGGLLRYGEDGQLHKATSNLQLAEETSKKTQKRYHLDWIGVAERAIRSGSPEDRYLGGETIALSRDKLPEARQVINRCLDELAALAGQCQGPTAVYHCNVQLFQALVSKAETMDDRDRRSAC